MVFKNFIESMFWFRQTRPQTTLLLFGDYFTIQNLKQELSGTRAYKHVSAGENSIVNDHCSHLPLKFSVIVTDRQDKLPMMYWLPKLKKNLIKLDLLPTLARVLLLNFLNY